MQWCSIRGDFVRREYLAMRGAILKFLFDWGLFLEARNSERKPGMLDILQCTERPSTTENNPSTNGGWPKLRNAILNIKERNIMASCYLGLTL